MLWPFLNLSLYPAQSKCYKGKGENIIIPLTGMKYTTYIDVINEIRDVSVGETVTFTLIRAQKSPPKLQLMQSVGMAAIRLNGLR